MGLKTSNSSAFVQEHRVLSRQNLHQMSLLYPHLIWNYESIKSCKFWDFGTHVTISREPYNTSMDVVFVPLDTATKSEHSMNVRV